MGIGRVKDHLATLVLTKMEEMETKMLSTVEDFQKYLKSKKNGDGS